LLLRALQQQHLLLVLVLVLVLVQVLLVHAAAGLLLPLLHALLPRDCVCVLCVCDPGFAA
jgi:hypothetical protein